MIYRADEQGGQPLEQDVGEPIDWDPPHYEMTDYDVDAFAASLGE